ncbi:ABC transporter permease [Clostridium sp. AM58-1XD]|uniref:ABC transporter permease n=1 Tax=Clostridium sp. AM58-1XD TaxID=2292307 RepID=UPI000E46C913|nr:ABC transporter permease [Clostridium sp. AM58-1XD]RGY98869.1 ABC transporter permease [Clostridium sp. AM58-1XD]
MNRFINNRAAAFFKRFNIPGMAYSTALFFLFFGFLTGWRIAAPANVLLILRNSAVLILASIGMNMVILVSQVDISIGPVMSLAGAVVAVVLNAGLGLAPSILSGLVVGMAVGLLNGILIAVFRFDYWITTFATMGICSGLALVVADGGTVPISNKTFNWLGNGKVGGIYVMIYITAAVVAAVIFVLRRTKFGYNIYSIGGSEISARLNGLNVVKNRILVFICSGFFAAAAGIILSAMSSSANPIGGANYSFDAMAAVIIGGTTFEGGRGSLAGTVFGALMLRILSNGLGCMSVPATWQRQL